VNLISFVYCVVSVSALHIVTNSVRFGDDIIKFLVCYLSPV